MVEVVALHRVGNQQQPTVHAELGRVKPPCQIQRKLHVAGADRLDERASCQRMVARVRFCELGKQFCGPRMLTPHRGGAGLDIGPAGPLRKHWARPSRTR